jgi:hypothetical protein
VRAGEEISAELQKENPVYVAHGLYHPRAGVGEILAVFSIVVVL